MMPPNWFGPLRPAHDSELAWARPKAKMRGRRRYYRTLRQTAARFQAQPDGWYDFMHWHVDWLGIGNRSWRERREHLAALFTIFRRLLAEVAAWPTPHQVWLQIDAYDSREDAVYLHTPNPNGTTFPYDFAEAQWDASIPTRLREFVTESAWQFGRIEADWTAFIVRLRPTK